MKKIYILALTFLTVFCGQLGYGQGIGNGGYENYDTDANIANLLYPADANGIHNLSEVVIKGSHPKPNAEYHYSSSSNNFRDIYNSFDIDYSSTLPDDDYRKELWKYSNWIIDQDGDNYYTATVFTIDSPGPEWKKGYGSGLDCDDSNSNITRECFKYYYVDYDNDGYHSSQIYSPNDNGGEYKTTTLGRDCDDSYDSITTQCYPNWYQDKDEDGYHSAILKTENNPGIGWKMGTSNGVDCDDNDSTKTAQCLQLPCPENAKDGIVPNGKVIGIFFQGGPTGGGNIISAIDAGGAGNHFINLSISSAIEGKNFTGEVIAPGITATSGVDRAEEIIKKVYQSGDQIVIYGYSWGGDLAVDLATELKKLNELYS